jgi:hypothetical protein
MTQPNPFAIKRSNNKWSLKLVGFICLGFVLAFIAGVFFREMYIDYQNNKHRNAHVPEGPSSIEPKDESQVDNTLGTNSSDALHSRKI